jgi:hypothetical protein
MSGQTLIFGIGATKAGTSWLWDYLYGHDETYFPAVKELHYFDALEMGSGPFFRRDLEKRLAGLQAKRAQGALRPFARQVLEDGARWLGLFDGKTPNDAGYLDFVGLGRTAARVVGDFTPAYSLLREATFCRMAGLAERVRFIFLMRDPVARMWSNIRMQAGGDTSEETLDTVLSEVLEGRENNIAPRSNYRRTLTRLLAAVPREHVFLEFYERLFTPEAISRLCAFLGLAPRPAEFARVVHGGRHAVLPAHRLGPMTEFLKPQYNYVERLMGELPAEWTDKMVKA